ncbi:MAG: DMT family transporter, partial [Gammaproteobacteria bacterium]|nr:DMT family transporter [Gammaproteobacteria bacterium]
MAAIFWGGTFVAGKLLSHEIDPYSAAFLRFLLASLLLMPMVYLKERRFPPITWRQFIAVVLLGLTGIFAYNVFFFSGLKTVEAGRAALIIAANPVLIALLSWLFFGESITLRKGAGILISVAGAMVVIAKGDMVRLLAGSVGTGELFLMGCVVSWVSYTIIGKRVLVAMTPLTAVAYSCVVGAVALFLPALKQGLGAAVMHLDFQMWLNLLYLSVLGTVLGFVWFYRGVKEIGPARAGQFINIVPISGVFFGMLFLDEQLTLSLLIGGVLILAGLLMT